ncbi:MAG: superoxide dismutase family protein [Acidimicrobiia bacterium]
MAGIINRIGRRRIVLLAVLALGVVTVATATATAGSGDTEASTVLRDANGAAVGTARFVEEANGKVRLSVAVRGATPGLHGTHIHTVGSCDSVTATFSGAGAHFNPTAELHGSHAGDLPNLVAKANGLGSLSGVYDHFMLSVGLTSILDADGSALVVHADRDDYVTDPSGNSGARIFCGVITAG